MKKSILILAAALLFAPIATLRADEIDDKISALDLEQLKNENIRSYNLRDFEASQANLGDSVVKLKWNYRYGGVERVSGKRLRIFISDEHESIFVEALDNGFDYLRRMDDFDKSWNKNRRKVYVAFAYVPIKGAPVLLGRELRKEGMTGPVEFAW